MFIERIEDKLCDLCDRSSIWSRNTKGIKEILKNNPNLDINYKDAFGMCPIHHAISNKYHAALDLLFKYNANPSLLDRKGFSALDYAFKIFKCGNKKSSKRMTIKLLEVGIEANTKTLKKLIDYYGYDEDVIKALMDDDRFNLNYNKDNMVDYQILLGAIRTKHISLDTLKKLIMFGPTPDVFSNQNPYLQPEELKFILSRNNEVINPRNVVKKEHPILFFKNSASKTSY